MKMMSFRKVISLLIIASVLFSSMTLSAPSSSNFAQTFDTSNSITDYELNKTYSGFKLVSIKSFPEINSDIMIFNHLKTGARLMFVKNSDKEKVFSISFRTPAADDTGVNHIIEHSVLNGSKNYPVKSPFAEMLKRSLGTFINAMTANDYTIYPVSSVNEKDLQNLMSIYLDAVFYPKLQSDENIFKQEAWRYQLDSKESELDINGIVFSEMKGYYSDPSYILEREVYKSLFPDTSYKWDAGGNPDAIPTLTPEKFMAVHKYYYTPSNSYIFLYGKLDIGKYLEFIDKNYLSKMTKADTDTMLKPQKAFTNMVEKVSFYPILEDSNAHRKTYMSVNFVTGFVTDMDLITGLDFLNYLLMGTDNSPLKKALLDSRIADNFSCSFKPDSLQPIFVISAENSDSASKEIFKKTILNSLKKTVQTGFDKELLKHTFAQYDLKNRVRKVSEMKGLSLNFNIMKSWLYDKEPTLYVDNSRSIEKIKKLSDKKYFENLINKYLLSNTHSSLVVLKPSAGLESKSSEALGIKLEEYKKQLSSKAINSLVKATNEFKAWQQKPDSKKDLDTLPRLSIKDIKPELPDLKINIEKTSGVEILSHNVQLNDISSINFYFDTSKVPQDKLHYLNLLASLLGNVDTKKYTQNKLNNELLLYSSGISFSAYAAADAKDSDIYKPILKASFLTLEDNIPKSLGLLEEIINNSVFDNKAKVKQILQQKKLYMQQMYTSCSGTFASLKLNACLSEGGRYREELMGPGYYRFLVELENNFDKNWEDILKNLKEAYSLAFNRNRLIVSHSGDKNSLLIFGNEIQKIIPKLNGKVLASQQYKLTPPDKNLALPLPVKVQTLLKGGNFVEEGFNYSGKMLVLERVLNMDYLWKSVRTSGGAYGFNVDFSQNGLMSFMSTRDPNLLETLKIFDAAADYLKDFKATEDEMENYIIGAISKFLKIKSKGPLYEGVVCDNLYLTGLTLDDLIRAMDEVFSTKAKDIKNYSNMMEKVLKQNIYYVEGSKEKLNENKELFTRLESIVS